MTKGFKIYGLDGHRQRESFNDSKTFTQVDGVEIEIRNADKTGTNEYSEMWITAEDEIAINATLWGQISDGIFENSRVGRFEAVEVD